MTDQEQIETLTDKTLALADALQKQAEILQMHNARLKVMERALSLLCGGAQITYRGEC